MAAVHDVTQCHYDLVVVGGGPSGAAVAARASADPETRVLLIERGPDWRVADAPSELDAKTLIAYRGLPSLERFHSLDALARKTAGDDLGLYLGGQGLGGSSLINGGIVLRPPLEDYDDWAEMGATGWSSGAGLQRWRALESDREYGADPLHGSHGPLSVERTPYAEWSAIDTGFDRAAREVGYRAVDDLNGAYSDGVGPLPFGRRNGGRETANHVFIEPIRSRPNLTICGDTFVDRVALDATGSRVTGVVAIARGLSVQLTADRVVLAAGAIASAAVLLRSGIGPADELSALGVTVNQSLPVGRRVQDHALLSIAADWQLADDTDVLDRSWTTAGIRYSSGIGGAGAGDMLITPVRAFSGFGMRFPPAISVWLLQTFSWGSLHLRSADPTVWPDVNIGLYDDDRDLLRMRDGARRVVELIDAAAFDGLRGNDRSMHGQLIPRLDLDDDVTLDALVRAHTDLQVHISATAPMGHPDGDHTVVDETARVLGVDGLWVSDLSVCPKVSRANTWATAMLLGQWVGEIVAADMDQQPLSLNRHDGEREV